MIGFLLKRLLWLLLTLWVVFTVCFFLMRGAAGGPFDELKTSDPAIKKNLEARYKLDRPIGEQYVYELQNYLRGNLGVSIKLSDYRVIEVIAEGWPISLALGQLALTLAVVVGVSAGIIAALSRGKILDTLSMLVATAGIALPTFVTASLAVLIFVFILPIFPAGGWGNLQNLILPACCLAAPYAAYIARLTRTGMLEVLGQDYIRTAIAKGLPMSRVVLRHALSGALLPVVTFLGPATAGILTGSLVIEQIFAIPGLGTHFVQAALTKDFTLCMGLVLLYTTLVYLMNLVVDVAYTVLDPRVKLN
ncbi:MAG: ABC transporter permease [Pirellulales bacterium]|nr:ABC transporter permease [Pirellulales bacterium]